MAHNAVTIWPASTFCHGGVGGGEDDNSFLNNNNYTKIVEYVFFFSIVVIARVQRNLPQLFLLRFFTAFKRVEQQVMRPSIIRPTPAVFSSVTTRSQQSGPKGDNPQSAVWSKG